MRAAVLASSNMAEQIWNGVVPSVRTSRRGHDGFDSESHGPSQPLGRWNGLKLGLNGNWPFIRVYGIAMVKHRGQPVVC